MAGIEGTAALRAATKSPIAKRAEEKLTTGAAAKVAGKAAGKKAAEVVGKVAPVAAVMAQPQMGPKPTADDSELQTGKRFINPKDVKLTEPKKTETMKELFEKNANEELLPEWLKKDSKAEEPELKTASSPKLDYSVVPTAEVKTEVKEQKEPKEKEPEEKQPEENRTEQRTGDAELKLPAKKEEQKEAQAKTGKTSASNSDDGELDYHNILSYYRTGGFGDPQSWKAKRNMGFAVLDQIGKTAKEIGNIAMANAGKAGVANTTSTFDKEQNAGLNQRFSFKDKDKDFDLTLQKMDKELANNKDMQKELNNLQKDFQKWTLDNQITYGNDEEKLEALKKFVAANENAIQSGGWLDMAMKGVGAAVSLAPPILLALMRR